MVDRFIPTGGTNFIVWPDGDWVRYSDYEAVEQELAEARAERDWLITGMREAVDTLYNCRYSELPMARKLDALLKEITGEDRHDILMKWATSEADRRALSKEEQP